jgi:bifunctional non-homologous end joining protein LigD
VVVPLRPKATFHDASALAERVASIVIDRDPAHLTREFSKADRGGRILIDTGRNRGGATVAAPYTVRARRGAPVSAPCTWNEIESGVVHPQSFTLRTMRERLAKTGDLWADLLPRRPRQASVTGSPARRS